jgi:hypothetical protein
MDAEKTFER